MWVDSIYGRLTLSGLAEETGLNPSTLLQRKRNGIPDDLITVKNCRGLTDLKPLFQDGSMWLSEGQEKRLYDAYDEVNEEERLNVPHG